MYRMHCNPTSPPLVILQLWCLLAASLAVLMAGEHKFVGSYVCVKADWNLVSTVCKHTTCDKLCGFFRKRENLCSILLLNCLPPILYDSPRVVPTIVLRFVAIIWMHWRSLKTGFWLYIWIFLQIATYHFKCITLLWCIGTVYVHTVWSGVNECTFPFLFYSMQVWHTLQMCLH